MLDKRVEEKKQIVEDDLVNWLFKSELLTTKHIFSKLKIKLMFVVLLVIEKLENKTIR